MMNDKNLICNIELSDVFKNSNRIGIDTCLSEILNTDNNIRFLLLLCGIYQSTEDSKQQSYLWKIWSLLLICLTIIGLGGYVYNFILTIDENYDECKHESFHNTFKKSITAYIDSTIILLILPMIQLVSIVYSLYSINLILKKTAALDNLEMYKNSYRKTLIFMVSMLTNLIIVWITLYTVLPKCAYGISTMMLFYDFTTIFYSSYNTFFMISYIDQITKIQEEMISFAKKEILTISIYFERRAEIKKLNSDLNIAMQLLIITSLFNALSWAISMLVANYYYVNASLQSIILYIYSDSALYLKELVICIYLCIISVKINTLSDVLADELAKSDWLSNGSLEKDHMRLSLYIKVTSDPIQFKLLTKRLSLTDIYASIIAIISSITITFIRRLIQDSEN